MLSRKQENYNTFPVPIKKEYDNGKTITHKIKFIDSYRFMRSKLSDLADNFNQKVSKNVPILQW